MTPVVQREREQLHVVGAGSFEPVGEVIGAIRTDELGEPLNGVVGDGEFRASPR
jgi:hypothetical protein